MPTAIQKKTSRGVTSATTAVLGGVVLTDPEILASIESLYDDGLKPFGRVLLKRLRERAAAREAEVHGLPAETADAEAMPRIDPKQLRRICERCVRLRVVSEDGREFSATLVGRACEFPDVCSQVDNYPTELWAELAEYLGRSALEEVTLPGGRYTCARELIRRRLPFLKGFCLGEVCHIVQLAVGQKRLLGYRGGWLVPFQHSEARIKEECALTQTPTGTEGDLPVASWEDVRECLLRLLDPWFQPESSNNSITMSNVRRLFQTRFQLELSVTALGHVRLLDVLKDPRLHDVCSLHTQRSGQFLVTRPPQKRQQPCPVAPPGAWDAAACGGFFQMSAVPVLLPFAALDLSQDKMVAAWDDVGSDCSVALLSPGASPRGHVSWSNPWKSKGCSTSESTAEDCSLSSVSTDETEEGAESPRSLNGFSEVSACHPDETLGGQWQIEVKNTFIDVRGGCVGQQLVGGGARRRPHSVPP